MKSKLPGHKAIIAICCGVALSLAIIAFSNRATTPNRNNPYFSYGAGENRNGIIQVVDNNRVLVPIVFEVDRETTAVSLEFSGDHSLMPGVSLTDNPVAVVNGTARSKVIILFDSKPALKAGTHFLTIVARDAATGKIVRKGEISFTYNMHEVIGKCSC